MATALPSIDLEPFIASSGQGRQAVPRAIAQACEEVGFFKIRGHGLPQTLIDPAFATASDFFGQPQAIKDRSRPPKSARARLSCPADEEPAKTLGYDNPPDLREQFYTAPRQPRRRIRSYPRRRRALRREYPPQAPATYRQVFTAYYTELERLGGTLMRTFALGLGVDERLRRQDRPPFLDPFRPTTYPEPIGDPPPPTKSARASIRTLAASRFLRSASVRAACRSSSRMAPGST